MSDSQSDESPEPATENDEAVGGREALLRVLRNRRLRNVQLAFAGSTLGDWAYATAIVVWAYEDGGAAAVGGFQAARFVAMAVAGPLGAAIADRMSRRTFMMLTDAVRAVLVAAAALIIMADGPAPVVYVLAIVVAMVGAPFRAAQAGLIPSLVDKPSELTAANAVAGNLESAVIFAGPALGGLLIAVSGVEVVFWLNVATYVWSILLLASVRVRQQGSEPGSEEAADGMWRELTAGFRLVGRDGDLRAIAALSGSAGLAWGALTVFIVFLAVDQLGTGPEGIGYLTAVMGVATVVGGLLVLTRVSRGRLGQDMVVGTLGWGVPLLAMAAFPSPVTAVAALAAIGLADAFANLGFETIPQRVTPEQYVSRVYAAIETALIAPMALGAALAPVLIDLAGFRPALAVVGAVTVATALILLPRMRDLDRRLVEPEALPMLREVSIFAPLSPPALEALAHRVERRRVPAGERVLVEGGSSDEFFVIVTGSVEVTQGERHLRTEGPGEFFGEIGLLRDVPRTATVTATVSTELLVLSRADFLSSVLRFGAARAAAEEVAARRLAA